LRQTCRLNDSPACGESSERSNELVNSSSPEFGAMAGSSSLIGQIISHYSVVEKIGAGGMGVVYKAEDTQLRRVIALKLLPEQDGSDPKALEQLRRGARTASSLNHPNICAIYEVGEQSGEAFIAMTYVEGKSLSKLIRPEGLPVETVVRYGTQLASALEHAHNHGVLHRDLKPLNVIVTPQGDAKILILPEVSDSMCAI
jgi:serine/threonine protein kinase